MPPNVWCVGAWGKEGHNLVADIALELLTRGERKCIEQLLAGWAGESAELYQAANWHDELRKYRVRVMSPWHFASRPLGKPTKLVARFDIADALDDAVEILLDANTTSRWAVNFALRSVLHFMADVHCPMHAVTMYSRRFPVGDRGGNLQRVRCGWWPVCGNLHGLWDSAIWLLGKGERPRLTASVLMKEFPVIDGSSNVSNVKARDIVEESADIARDVAYRPGGAFGLLNIDSKYLEIARPVARRRLAIAGYRLAWVLRAAARLHCGKGGRMVETEL